MRRFVLLLVAMALFGVSVNGQSVRLESTFYKTVILTVYASETITVNTEAKGFTLSKIIPEDAATKGVSMFAMDRHFQAVAWDAAARSSGSAQRRRSPAMSAGGRLTRTLLGVAITRQPSQLSTFSIWKSATILSNNDVRPGSGSRTSRRP